MEAVAFTLACCLSDRLIVTVTLMPTTRVATVTAITVAEPGRRALRMVVGHHTQAAWPAGRLVTVAKLPCRLGSFGRWPTVSSVSMRPAAGYGVPCPGVPDVHPDCAEDGSGSTAGCSPTTRVGCSPIRSVIKAPRPGG